MRCTCAVHMHAVHMQTGIQFTRPTACAHNTPRVHPCAPVCTQHTAWHPMSTMVRGRSSAQSCRRCRKRMFWVTRCHCSTKGCSMRAESGSELKSTLRLPSFSVALTWRVTVSSAWRSEKLAGKTQSARAAPSARAERAAKRQAVTLRVLSIRHAVEGCSRQATRVFRISTEGKHRYTAHESGFRPPAKNTRAGRTLIYACAGIFWSSPSSSRSAAEQAVEALAAAAKAVQEKARRKSRRWRRRRRRQRRCRTARDVISLLL